MSALRNVEDTIGGFVERTFGRLFRGHVQPVELARKLAREMEDHKTVSVSRVYVPNEYVIYLSSGDRDRFASFEGALTTELGVYLSERARHEGFTLLSPPQIRLELDADLRVGEYGIACRVVDPPVEKPEEVDAASPDIPVIPPPFPPAAVPATVSGDAAEPEAEGAPDGAPAVEPVQGEAAADVEPGGAPEQPSPPEGVLADDVLEAAPAAGVPEVEAEPVAPEASAEPGAVEPVTPDAQPEPAPDAAAPAEPEPESAAPVEPPPAPPVPTPLPPPGGYEPLVGVSGTQILSAADARAEGLVQEEIALVVGGRTHRLSQRTTSIGRSRECDIVLGDANASRKHAEVRHIGVDYFIVDLGSTNGTVVNGQRVRRHALAHGDRILIGTTQIDVEHRT